MARVGFQPTQRTQRIYELTNLRKLQQIGTELFDIFPGELKVF